MAATLGKQQRMRRSESKKSHSWWWDSHISPKNSKWLQENLEEMDQNVKRMLKLIEEDADSFAKKAEMYYRKRPELISLVEEFYRMYRSLAERYDHVTGELRKNIPSDLQSQGSGISDVSSEAPSTWPSPDQQLSRRKSGPRPAGFEFFLGAGGNSTESNKEGDESSTLDSESESDDSSVNNYVGVQNSDEDQGSRRRTIDLEVKLRDANVQEKYRKLQEEISEGSYGGSRTANSEVISTMIAGYEEELKVAREKIKLSEEEINKLKDELQKYKSAQISSNFPGELDIIQKESNNVEASSELQKRKVEEFQEHASDSEVMVDQEHKIHALAEELKSTKEKLLESEKEVERLRLELQSNGSSLDHLKEQLGTSQKDITVWKAKVEKEKREVSKLQDRIVRYKSNLSERDREIRGLRETISNANESLSEENSQLQAEITRLLKEKTYLEDNIKEMDLRCQSLEEDARRIKAGKTEMEAMLGAEIEKLKAGKTEMEAMLGAEIEELKAGIDEKNDNINELNRCLDELKLRYHTLVAEKDSLDAKIATHVAEISSKYTQISEMNKHLHQLHMEHVELIAGAEGARKQVEELRSRVRELEQEVERQKQVILEGAEKKREAIRQLCFSLEHYRDGYHQLRQAFTGHKRLTVMAS